ncbi:MAG: hypothetical protein KIT00_08170 [Rhodospirillales bacterium]|nr:hypothetical protein [Rhodospirillales bacterium]
MNFHVALLHIHTTPPAPRARMLAIACGYEDCGALDVLRRDPAFKLACEWPHRGTRRYNRDRDRDDADRFEE